MPKFSILLLVIANLHPDVPDDFTTLNVAQPLGRSVRSVPLVACRVGLDAWKTLCGHRRISCQSVPADGAAPITSLRSDLQFAGSHLGFVTPLDKAQRAPCTHAVRLGPPPDSWSVLAVLGPTDVSSLAPRVEPRAAAGELAAAIGPRRELQTGWLLLSTP